MAVKYFKNSAIFTVFLCFLKMIGVFGALPFNTSKCNWGQLEYWCICIAVHSSIAIIYYIVLFKMSKNKEAMLDIAENLAHVNLQ